jgi:hypothetical protein
MTVDFAESSAGNRGLGQSPRPEPSGFLANWLRKKSVARVEPPSLANEQMDEFPQMIVGARPATDEIADELAFTLGLAQRIYSGKIHVDGAHKRLKFVLDCLLATPSKPVEARAERFQLQFDVYRHAGWFTRTLTRVSSGSPIGVLLLALGASIVLWMLLALAIRIIVDRKLFWNLSSDIFFMNGGALAVISSAAFLGGMISIATRLKEFSRVRDLDPVAMFWTAMLKPLIGVVLSWFLLAALAGDVVSFSVLGTNPLGLDPDNATPEVPDKVMYLLWVVGFLTGFSERFAWDFVDRAQGIVVGGIGAGGARSGGPRTGGSGSAQQDQVDSEATQRNQEDGEVAPHQPEGKKKPPGKPTDKKQGEKAPDKTPGE